LFYQKCVNENVFLDNEQINLTIRPIFVCIFVPGLHHRTFLYKEQIPVKYILNLISGRKGEIQTTTALILTIILSQVDPFAERAFQLGVLTFTAWEGVGYAMGVFLLAAGGWMLNQVFQTQRPDSTRNSLYFLAYILLTLSITNARHLFSTAAIGFLFALSISGLHQATFQRRPESLLSMSGFLMAFLIVLYPVAYPWLLILILLLILAEEFSLRMLWVFVVGAVMVPYLWFSYSYLFNKPALFPGWQGVVPWGEPDIVGSFGPISWVMGVGALPVVGGIMSTLVNRPSRTQISRSTQWQMGVLLVSGICLLILAATHVLPVSPQPLVVLMLPPMTYIAARGLERLSPRLYSELFLWVWMALVCGGAKGLNRWVFSAFLP